MRVGYHLVEKKNAVTADATVAMTTQVAGSAISAFQARLEIMLVLFLKSSEELGHVRRFAQLIFFRFFIGKFDCEFSGAER